MLVGHFAIGLIGKRIEPRVSLVTWVLAALLADIILFPLLILGIERFEAVPGAELNRVIGSDIVFSHSLLMDLIWGVVFAASYFFRRHSSRAALLLFAAVVSHWVLDFISHRPDMPLAPGIEKVYGLGLWNSFPATLVVEGGFWLLALVLYARATRPTGWMGVIVLWVGALLLTIVWNANIHGGIDPNPVSAGVGGLIFFSLLVAWAYWTNRLRPTKV